MFDSNCVRRKYGCAKFFSVTVLRCLVVPHCNCMLALLAECHRGVPVHVLIGAVVRI